MRTSSIITSAVLLGLGLAACTKSSEPRVPEQTGVEREPPMTPATREIDPGERQPAADPNGPPEPAQKPAADEPTPPPPRDPDRRMPSPGAEPGTPEPPPPSGNDTP